MEIYITSGPFALEKVMAKFGRSTFFLSTFPSHSANLAVMLLAFVWTLKSDNFRKSKIVFEQCFHDNAISSFPITGLQEVKVVMVSMEIHESVV